MTKEYAVLTAFFAAIALTVCLAEPSAAAVFISDLAVLAMISLCEKSAVRFAGGAKAVCVKDCAAFAAKIAFVTLCALSGGVIIHAAALIINYTADNIFKLFSYSA